MASSLTITRHPYEEPYHVDLVVRAVTDGAVAEQRIYANATDLIECADAFQGFPRRADDVYSWELGSEQPEDRFAFYFRLTVRMIRGSGRCAVHLRFNNNEDFPRRRVAEFAFGAMPTDLDRLGRAFRQFARLQDTVLEWAVGDDELS